MSAAVDVVVVGASPVGPVIAARLSEDPSLQVPLVEGGGENVNEVGRMRGDFFCT